jgi:hypothetical protein
MGMREDVRNGRLNPEKAIEKLRRTPGHSKAMMDWLVNNGRRLYEKAIEDKVAAEEAAKLALAEGRAKRGKEE